MKRCQQPGVTGMRWASKSDERMVYLTSRENKEAQYMREHSRVNKVGTQSRQQQGYNVLRDSVDIVF